MANIEQKDPRFKNLEKKVGMFVFLVVVMLLAIFFLMGKERGIFTKKYHLFFIVDSGSGFIEGMPVKLSGFKIGKVKGLSLTSEAKVKVSLEINKEYQKWIREGSVARMMKEGVIGESIIDVTVGHASAATIKDESEIPYEKVMGIEELVAKEVKPVLQEIQETIGYINNPEGDIKKAIGNVRKLSEGLLTTKENLDVILKETKNTIHEATSVISQFGNIGEKAVPVVEKLSNVAQDAEKASKKIPEVMEKADKIMDDVKNLSDVLSKKSGNIKDMLENAEDALNDTKEIIKGAKESWPINSMLPPKEEMKIVPLEGSEKER